MADQVNRNKQLDAGLRQRRLKSENRLKDNNRISETKEDATRKSNRNKVTSPTLMERGSYWLTRIVILRFLGFIYFVAFLVALHQNKQLIGSNGLLPADRFLNSVKRQTGGINLETVTNVPSILWLFDYNKNLNSIFDYISYTGLALSSILIIWGGANWFIMLTLWVLYHSLVNIGQRWYGFGWESQLLETGFLAVFLCPLFSVSRLPSYTPTSQIVLWGYRWLIFRIMIGAGLIKIRGDQCWRDLTCMNYHYETQPVPNPMSYFMHQSPEPWHKFETLSNHFVELVAPLFLLLPLRIPSMVGGSIQICFQIVLIISGNLSFLNWLTILPSLACFDDVSYSWLFGASTLKRVAQLQKESHKPGRLRIGNYIRRVWNIMLGVLIAYLSIPVVQNLLSSRQHMNTSFDPLRLVNTYGAFGSVTKERTELIIQGTYDNPSHAAARWQEYEFKCKPGNVSKRPCIISPYHYRLDWLVWFAAFQANLIFVRSITPKLFQNYRNNPWVLVLAAKLFVNDNETSTLLEHNPFINRQPPMYIKIQHYRYQFTKIGSKEAAKGKWWKRTYIQDYIPPVTLQSLKPALENMNMKVPKYKKR